MEQYQCPLCKQSVSKAVFERITGIWQEKESRLAVLRNKEKALLQREQKLKEKFDTEKKLIADRTHTKFVIELDRRTRTLRNSLRKERAALNTARTKIQTEYKRKLVSETNRVVAMERIRRAHMRSELKQRFEEQSRVKMDKAQKALASDQEVFERDKKLQLNRYNQLNKQFQSMQNKSVTEIQKREMKIQQLQEQLKKNETPQVLGLLNETEMLRALQEKWPTDKFDHTGKGGDIVHHVISGKKEIGVMVYELKKVGHFNNAHITQTWKAKQQRNADYALLITNAKRSKIDMGFSTAKGVIVIHPAGALTMIGILRDHLLAISKLQLSGRKRDETTKAVLEYIQSPSFKNGIESIISNTVDLYAALKKEVKDHVGVWKDRFDRYGEINATASQVGNKVIRLAMSKDELKKLSKAVEIVPIELPAEIK